MISQALAGYYQKRGRSLDAKLDAAVKQLDRGKDHPRGEQLEAFLRQLDALVRSERLDAPEIAVLRAQGVQLIQAVSS